VAGVKKKKAPKQHVSSVQIADAACFPEVSTAKRIQLMIGVSLLPSVSVRQNISLSGLLG